MGNYPKEYGAIYSKNLLNRIKAIYGEEFYLEKKVSIAAGPGYEERMEKFYEWCYQNDIQPL